MASSSFVILTALEHFQLSILMLPSPFSAESVNMSCSVQCDCSFVTLLCLREQSLGILLVSCYVAIASHLEKQLLTSTNSFRCK